jgi:HAD superfamily hydrolase (TIGR01458 family)
MKGFLIDLDGVIYTGDRPIPGAAEALRLMEESGFSFRFVSNTTRTCRHTLREKLSGMGLHVPEDYIFTPPIAAAVYMKRTGKSRFRLLVTSDVMVDFPVAGNERDPGKRDYVIVGDAGNAITYESLNASFRDLMEGAELIALEKDRYWMASDGLSLSAGPFVTALEFAAGKKAVLMGKPSKTFFDLALMDMGLYHDQVAMIGDDIQTDIRGAQDAGMRGILVKTGKYREELVKKTSVRPDLTIESIADIRKVLDAVQNNSWEHSA